MRLLMTYSVPGFGNWLLAAGLWFNAARGLGRLRFRSEQQGIGEVLLQEQQGIGEVLLQKFFN